MSLSKDVSLLYELGCLRFINRTWKQFLNANFENVAEHILRVTWIAYIIAKHEKVTNVNKVIKLALIHDVSESRVGDVNYLTRQYNTRQEEKAMLDMFKNTVLEKEILDLWSEYSKQETIESKIVKDADNLDVDFELQEQRVSGNTLPDSWHTIRNHVATSKLHTKTAKLMWKEIQNSSPHDWHLMTNNRFNSGDWKKEKSK